MKKDNSFVAKVIFNAAIKEELGWRKQKKNKIDVALLDELLEEIRDLGFQYEYLSDITKRDNTNKQLLSTILGYIGRFSDKEISAELVEVVGKKGNTQATKIILDNYLSLSDDEKNAFAAYYDNALGKIEDKCHISAYISLLENPKEAIRLPVTMIMLGKWNLESAKPYFMSYLGSNLFYLNEHVSDLVFIALEALSYYYDEDGTILDAFQTKLETTDKDLLSATKKAIHRLKSHTANP